MKLFYIEIESPLGKLKLVASAEALVAVLWQHERASRVKFDQLTLDLEHPLLLRAERQLGEYFSSKRTEFDLPLDPKGTEFQKRVWRALRDVPFGKTQSYSDLAKRVGSSGVRAVGSANGKNPLSIVVPCHRIIGSDGSLTGYAGGLEVKAALLALEAGSSASMNH